MTDIILRPTSDKAFNAKFVNEIGATTGLWDSVDELNESEIIGSGDTLESIVTHLVINDSPRSATAEFFTNTRLKSRSNIDTITANIVIDTNIDPYNITALVMDDNDLVIASGNINTVTEQQINGVLSKIQGNINAVKVSHAAHVQNVELFLNNVNGLVDAITKALPNTTLQSRTFLLDTPNSLKPPDGTPLQGTVFGPMDFFGNQIHPLFDYQIALSDALNFMSSAVLNNIGSNQQGATPFSDELINDELILFSDIDKLKDKTDSADEFLDTINSITILDNISIIDVVGLGGDLLDEVVLGLAAVQEGLNNAEAGLATLALSGSPVRDNQGNIIDDASEALDDIEEGTFKDIVELFRTRVSDNHLNFIKSFSNAEFPGGSGKLAGRFTDLFFIFGDVGEVIGRKNNAGEEVLPSPLYPDDELDGFVIFLAEQQNFFNQLIGFRASAQNNVDLLTAILGSQIDPAIQADFEKNITELQALVDHIKQCDIPMVYNRDGAAFFDLQPKYMSFTIVGSSTSNQNVENIKLFTFITTIKDNIDESMREAGKCGECDPVPVCDDASYFHQLSSGAPDIISDDDPLTLNDSNFVYYGERLVREQESIIDLKLSTATVDLRDKVVSAEISIVGSSFLFGSSFSDSVGIPHLDLTDNDRVFFSSVNVKRIQTFNTGSIGFTLFVTPAGSVTTFADFTNNDGLFLDLVNLGNVNSEINDCEGRRTLTDEELGFEFIPDGLNARPTSPFIEVSGDCDSIFHTKHIPNFAKGSFYVDFLHPDTTGSGSPYFDDEGTHISDHVVGYNEFAQNIISQEIPTSVDEIFVPGSVRNRPFINQDKMMHHFSNYTITLQSKAKANIWMSPSRKHDGSGGFKSNLGAGLFFDGGLAVFIKHGKLLSEGLFGTILDGSFTSMNNIVVDDSSESGIVFRDGDELTVNLTHTININVNPIYNDKIPGLRRVIGHSLAIESGGFVEATVSLNGGCLHNDTSSITLSNFQFKDTPVIFGVAGFGGFEAKNLCLTNGRTQLRVGATPVSLKPVTSVAGFTPV